MKKKKKLFKNKILIIIKNPKFLVLSSNYSNCHPRGDFNDKENIN